MGKYIDADKLKAKIERLYYNEAEKDESILAADAYKNALDAVEKFLDSLQQEQQKSKKDCNGCPHCVDRKDQYGWHFKGCFGGPYNGKFIAEIDECPLKQEQPEVDLEEEIAGMYQALFGTDVINRKEMVYLNTFEAIARHFYELGLNARKEE